MTQTSGQASVSPNVWGHAAWHMLHRMSFSKTLRDQDHDGAVQFFRSIVYILPCKKCRNNMSDHLKHLPVPMSDNKNKTDANVFAKWVWRLHTRVSESLPNKNDYVPPTFAQVKTRYSHYDNDPHLHYDSEHQFLFALVKTHPGARAITGDHLKALQTFMYYYIIVGHKNDCLFKLDADQTFLKSKTEFKQVIAKLTRTKTSSKLFNLPECST